MASRITAIVVLIFSFSLAQAQSSGPGLPPPIPGKTGEANTPPTNTPPAAPPSASGGGSTSTPVDLGGLDDDGPGSVKFSEAQPEDITNENFPDLIESFDYPNADITEVVKAISKLTGKNFILDNNVRGKITIIAPSQITAAEAYRAFLSALAINGLTVVPSGKFLKIRQSRAAQRDSIETYAGGYFPNTDQVITRVIKLKYISAEEVQKQIRTLTSKDGEMSAYSPTNSLIISDYGSNIERIQSIINQLDVPGFEEQLAVIRIRYAKAKDIQELLDQIINKGQGKSGKNVPRFRRTGNNKGAATSGKGAESYSLVVADERTNSIIVVGNKAGIGKIKSLIRKLDFKLRPEDAGGVHVYYVRHQESEAVANVLNGVAADAKAQQQAGGAGGSGGSSNVPRSTPNRRSNTRTQGAANLDAAVFGGDVKVTADKVTNSLIITASKQDYEVVRSLLAKIDIPRDQVFVKTVIMEMDAQKNSKWGLDVYLFNSDSNGIGRVGFRSSSIGEITDPSNDQGLILGLGDGNVFELEAAGTTVSVPSTVALIQFLKSNRGANILSTPQVLALDNEEAEIEVGQTIPVGSVSNSTAAGTTQSIQREKATIKLNITPFISPDTDKVRLKIDQQIKQASSQQVEAADLAQSSVVTNDRNLKTVIVLDSGDTAVLGGLMTDQEEQQVTKVPILGDIPILGWLFKAKSVRKTKRNLLVFITPKIIRNARDNADLLDQKLNERVDFIQRAMNGRDPFGAEVDALPRKLKARSQPEEFSSPAGGDEEFGEEPAAETF